MIEALASPRVPSGWKSCRLSDFVTHKSGDSKIIKGKQSAVPADGLVQGFSASGPDVWVREAQYSGPGVVVSAVGARCGKTFLAGGSWTAIANTHVLIPSAEVDNRFLWYLTNREDWWLKSGTAQPFVKVKDSLLRPFQLPPIAEQRKVVEILEEQLARLDAVLKSVQTVREKAAQFRRSLLHAALTGLPSKPEISGRLNCDVRESHRSSWRCSSLRALEAGGVLQLGRGKIISKRDIANMPGDYPIYSSASLNNGEFGRYGKFDFDEELITWSIDGGGRLFYRPRHKFSVTNVGGWIRILDLEIFDYRYLHLALSYLHSNVKFDWSRKAHPSVIRLVYEEIPVPPLSMQKQIVEIVGGHLARLDTGIAVADEVERKATALRRSLLHAAFSGELTRSWREANV